MSKPELEGRVLVEFRKCIREYCFLASLGGPRDGQGSDIQVRVITPFDLGQTCRADLDEYARKAVAGQQLDARVFLYFDSTPGGAFDIVIRPAVPGQRSPDPNALDQRTTLLGGRKPDDPDDRDAAGAGQVPTIPHQPTCRQVGEGPRRVSLIFRAGNPDDSWTYPLLSSPLWIPLGRGIWSRPGRQVHSLPDRARIVPRGPLIQLRCQGDEVDLRRSEHRIGEYLVSVDGQQLHCGHTARIEGDGTLSYSSLDSRLSAVLTYQVSRRPT
ncbi:MAG: hypothetical protein JXA67_17925 [Micromonosporaceae bacterium]|nr:hypothetical protein [Micromonosporaceae bacterium]